MRNMKKVVAVAMTAIMAMGMLAGCGGKSSKEESGVPTLKWITVGNGMPKNYDKWLEQVNPYLEEKIGAHVEMEIVPWGDWDNRRSVIANSGEEFDILFTDQTRYNSEVSSGVFLDISDKVKEVTPELYSFLPEDYWKAVSLNSKIYGIPTYKDSSLSQYFVWDKDIADKYGIDITKVTDFESVYTALKTVKDGEGKAPYYMSRSGVVGLIDLSYDDLSLSSRVFGVKYGDETATVVNPFEDKELLSILDVVHKMYKEGIINGDAPTADDQPGYHMFFMAQGWSGAAKTSWGPNYGIKNCEAVQFGPTVVANKTVQGSINGISASSKYPDEALKLLQLINTDTKLRDLFYYGVEGENWKYSDDNKVERLNTDWSMAGYTQGSFFTVSQQVTEEFNQWDEVRELNENATPSELLGFSLDTSKVQTELANCNAVYEKYYPEFFTGAQEPRKLLETIKKELQAAGWEKVQQEAQAQVDAFLGK